MPQCGAGHLGYGANVRRCGSSLAPRGIARVWRHAAPAACRFTGSVVPGRGRERLHGDESPRRRDNARSKDRARRDQYPRRGNEHPARHPHRTRDDDRTVREGSHDHRSETGVKPWTERRPVGWPINWPINWPVGWPVGWPISRSESRLASIDGKTRATDGNAPGHVVGDSRHCGGGGGASHDDGEGKSTGADRFHVHFLQFGADARLQRRARWGKNVGTRAPVDEGVPRHSIVTNGNALRYASPRALSPMGAPESGTRAIRPLRASFHHCSPIEQELHQ